MVTLAAALATAATSMSARSASACPSCAVGEAARREFWSDHFLANLATAALPFFLIGLACFALERGSAR